VRYFFLDLRPPVKWSISLGANFDLKVKVQGCTSRASRRPSVGAPFDDSGDFLRAPLFGDWVWFFFIDRLGAWFLFDFSSLAVFA